MWYKVKEIDVKWSTLVGKGFTCLNICQRDGYYDIELIFSTMHHELDNDEQELYDDMMSKLEKGD